MSIRAKTTISFFVLSVVAIGLSIWAISAQLMSGFQTIELDRAKENQSQVKEAFYREIVNTETKVSDWSQWDDTYEFVTQPNREYIASNLNDASLVQLKIQGILFIKNRQVEYAALLDPQTHTPATMSAALAEHATSSALLSSLTTSEAVKSDVAIIDNLPVILSARGVFMSDGDGPSPGQIVFVKYVTPVLIQELRDTTRLNFSVTPYTTDAMVGSIGKEMREDADEDEEKHIHIASENVIESDVIVRSEANAPVLYIKLFIPRTIYQQGIHSVRLLVGIGIFWGCSFIFLLLLLLDRLVLRRLEQINAKIIAIGQSKDPARRLVDVRGTDEMSDLAHTINMMLESLEQTGKDLQARNADLESSKAAMLNILEDERVLEDALKHEKEGIERKVLDRTRELEGEKARLLASINSLNVGYVLTDTEGSIIASNDLMHAIFSLHGELLTVESIDDRLGASFDLRLRFRACIAENAKIVEKNISMGGSILDMHLIPVSLRDGDTVSVIGAVLLIEDVTEQRVLERSKDEFFSIASHELRTPLTAIRGNSSLIKEYYKDAMKDPSLAEMINDMHESSIRLISIVNDFLDMSRLEMKKISFQKEAFSVWELMNECLVEFQGLERERQVSIGIDEAADTGLVVIADKNKTKQVLLNLLSNAVKFTEKGTIIIHAQKDGSQKFVEVSVRDTGKGISEAGKRLLFHKFQQAQDNTLTRDMTRGTGLGLYISKLMIEGMGGSIWLAESIVGKGSTFVFSLPV